MKDGRSFFRERFSTIHDFAERLLVRWGLVHRAIESLHGSLIAEHGPELLRPEATIPVPASPEVAEHARNVAQFGGSALDLNAQYERAQFSAEAEDIDSERRAQQARLSIDAETAPAAYPGYPSPPAEVTGENHEFSLPA